MYSDNEVKDENLLRQEQKEFYRNCKETNNLIKTYSEKLLAYADKKENLKRLQNYEEIEEFTWNFPIKPEETFIKLFLKRDKESINTNFTSDMVIIPAEKENTNYHHEISNTENLTTNIGKIINRKNY